MLKNKEVKKLLIVNVIIMLISLALCLIFNFITFQIYKRDMIKNNSELVGTLISEHPELENEIIDILMSDKRNAKEGIAILNKYGLDDSKYLDYFANNDTLKKKMIFYNIIFCLFISFNTFITYIIFLKNQYKKINHIDKYMNNILHDDYSLDIRDYNEGDLSNLKNDVYKMTVKLKEQTELSIKNKNALADTLADISHQIKTPLTSMYVINDILSDNNLTDKSKQEFLNKNRTQLERLEWLVTTLLKLSRLDSGTVTLKREQVDLNQLINKAIMPIKIMMELKNIKLHINSIDCQFKLDFNWTSEALTNILKNACEHTKSSGNIWIDVIDNPLYLNIKISDDGTGIKKEDLNHIFERFYKGSHNKDSIGIGLNLSKKIIDLQDGVIECFSELDKGTTFDIKFYKKDI